MTALYEGSFSWSPRKRKRGGVTGLAEVDHHHAVLGCLLNSLKAFIELPVAKLVVAAVMEPTVERLVQCRARRAAALALRASMEPAAERREHPAVPVAV